MKKNQNKKSKTEKAAPKPFAELLAEKLREMQVGEVEYDYLSDGSGGWVGLRIGDMSLHFSFDGKGDKMDRIGVYKDVIQKVDEKQLYSFEKPKPKTDPRAGFTSIPLCA